MKRATEIASADTEGIEGGKLTPGRDQMERGVWQTLVQINSNDSLIDRIRQQSNVQAQSARVFEYLVPLADAATPGRIEGVSTAPAIVAELRENYGKIGEYYSTILGLSSDDLQSIVQGYEKKFEQLVKAQPQERFSGCYRRHFDRRRRTGEQDGRNVQSG